MSQNWFPEHSASGQYGRQQPHQQQQWGNQQQGWVQGGQWVGQPHPQQTGYYGNQQQSFPMGYQQGQPLTQQFGQQQQQFGLQKFPQQQQQQQQFNQRQQFNQQQQFGQQAPQPQQPPVPQQGGGGGGFKTQQAYAQEHERRVKEEKKKKELEQQKKKLQSLSVSKQTVNLDDLFEKQLPDVSGTPQTSVVRPNTALQTNTGGTSGQGDSVGVDEAGIAGTNQSATGLTGNGIGSIESGAGETATCNSDTPPTTADTYQKLMAESLDITGSAQTKKAQFRSAFKQSAKKVVAQHSQSMKARSWDATSDDFAGMFAQHQQEQPQQEVEQDGNFGDFQSSDLPPSEGDFAAFPVSNQSHVPAGQHAQLLPNIQPSGHVFVAGLGQTGGVVQSGSHVIATSAYPGPLSSTNVLLGMQGQSPSSQQRQTTSSHPPQQSSMQSAPDVIAGQPLGAYRASSDAQQNAVQHSLFHMNPAVPSSSAPQIFSTLVTEPVNFTPQVSLASNFGPPASGSSGPPALNSPSQDSGFDASHFHPLYHKVFRRCRKPGDDFVSTELLYPVLLSSKLSRVQLRNLWSRANKGQPGRLSQMELFVLLGLVALAQGGNANPSLEDLKRTSSMPIPTLPALSALSPTADDDFGAFHSSVTQLPSQLRLQATPTGPLLPQPVPIPVNPDSQLTSAAPANPVKLEIPVQLQPIQPILPPPPAKQPPLLDSSISSDRVFRNVSPTGTATPSSDLTAVSVPQLSTDRGGTFEGLRPRSNSPQVIPNSFPARLSASVPPSLHNHLPVQPPAEPLAPLSARGQSQPLGIRVPQVPPVRGQSQPLGVGAPQVPPVRGQSQPLGVGAPQVPPAFGDQTGTKGVNHGQPQEQEDDIFGDFAHFATTAASAQPTSTPNMGPLFPTSMTGGLTMPVSSNPTLHAVSPATTDTTVLHGVAGTFGIPPSGGESAVGDLQESGDVGWADFGQFSSALTPQLPPTTYSAQELMNEVQQPVLLTAVSGGNEPLGDQGEGKLQPQKSTDSSPSRSRGFEFQRRGSKSDQGAVPTIDGMEKELLSKLTPTMPRKNVAKDGGSDSSSKHSQKSEQSVEKTASHLHPAKKPAVRTMGGEEGWEVCLVKCGEVLGACVEVLKEVEEENLLQEIAQSEESQNKLHGLAEIYRFAKRIYAALTSKHPTTTGSAAAEDVRKYWQELNSLLPDNTMEKIYSTERPGSNSAPTEDPTDVLSDTISHCALCLMSKKVAISPSLSLDGRAEEYSLRLLFHNGQSYHAPCANFWRHLVSEDIPVLE